jgi:opacity protein-like surface antigen
MGARVCLPNRATNKGTKFMRKAILGAASALALASPAVAADYPVPRYSEVPSYVALWTERVNRFMARKVEPPTHYVQHVSKAKKPTKAPVSDKKKTKVAAAEKKEKKTN